MIVFATTPGQRQLLVEYLASRLRSTPRDVVGNLSFEVAAVLKQGRMLGAVLYTNYQETDVEIKVAGDPGWITRRAIRHVLGYPFAVLGVRRISLQIHKPNKKARTVAEGLGFKLEGVKREAAPTGGHITLYGMTKKDWLNGPKTKAASSS